MRHNGAAAPPPPKALLLGAAPKRSPDFGAVGLSLCFFFLYSCGCSVVLRITFVLLLQLLPVFVHPRELSFEAGPNTALLLEAVLELWLWRYCCCCCCRQHHLPFWGKEGWKHCLGFPPMLCAPCASNAFMSFHGICNPCPTTAPHMLRLMIGKKRKTMAENRGLNTAEAEELSVSALASKGLEPSMHTHEQGMVYMFF